MLPKLSAHALKVSMPELLVLLEVSAFFLQRFWVASATEVGLSQMTLKFMRSCSSFMIMEETPMVISNLGVEIAGLTTFKPRF